MLLQSRIRCVHFPSLSVSPIPQVHSRLPSSSPSTRHQQNDDNGAAAVSSSVLTPSLLSPVDGPTPWRRTQTRRAHKKAAPPCPNLENIRRIVHQKLQPIEFRLKNNYPAAGWHYDILFKGLLCSPLFEGKTYGEMKDMVDQAMTEIGMKGRVYLHCEPPSRYEKMRRLVQKRWPIEK
mmetsp:Transcript_7324/g.14319  ORF Transcript_7324/g.14319 Transcript_7324/m.14319 type:complete len:178 (+) Transcript_7324:233-766(+)